MKQVLEMYVTLVLSTAHLSLDDKKCLEHCVTDPYTELIVDNTEYGWRVYIPNITEIMEFLTDNFSDNFKTILTTAQQRSCRWVEFDCDGLLYDQFEEFE
jgi:hypothetical protein